MSTNYIGKNSIARFLEKLYETFSKKGHAHSKADILDFPSLEGFVTQEYVDESLSTKQPVGDYALKSEIPTDYLTEIPAEYVTETELNAKGYLTSFTETDPTVPAWAKAANKPTYTASEVGALPANTVIPTVPTNVSAFTNDAGYLTEHQSLAGLATETYVNTSVSNHNANTSAHNDIRLLINGLTTRLNTLADSDDTTLDQMSEVVAYIKSNKNLIDGITTSKVNISDIVNNLTTNVTNKPLSASQGVAIKSLIDALEEELDSHTHSISDVSGLQSALDGKAGSSHGTHVSYSTTAPVMDGTASVGSASTVARSDHKHPTDTSRAAASDLTSHTGNTTVHITSTERTNWNAAKTHADSAHAPSNAEANQNAFSNVVVGSTTIAADSKTDTLTLVAGSNVTLTPDATNDKITIAATDTVYTHPAGSGASKSSGLYKFSTDSTSHINGVTAVTKADITGLGIPAQDTTYSAAGSSLGLVKTGGDVTISDGVITVNDDSHNHVISNIDGLQTALDGKAASSHGTHVSYGTSATAVGATASAGTASTVSRSDHTHSLSKSAVTTALGYTPPTTDTNTTYTVATGDSNGQIKVTPSSGSAYNVSVKGLGSAAYTNSGAYAAAEHDHNFIDTFEQSAYDVNKCYDAGLYMVASGNNCPTGSQYGTLLTLPYRKRTGNTTPDFGTQIFIPNGDDTTKPNSMLYRTSLSGSWNSWKEVATTSTATTSAAGLMSASDKSKLDGIASGANKITVDSALSSTSTNPVQNKAVYTAINNIKGVPSCSTSNNGQFLRVVSGVATWSTVPSAEEATF